MVWISLNLSDLDFSKVHESVSSCLVQIWMFLVIVSSNTLSFPFSFSSFGILMIWMLNQLLLSQSFLRFCWLFFQAVFSLIQIGHILLICPQIYWFCLLSAPLYYWVCICSFCLLLHFFPLNFFVSFFFCWDLLFQKNLQLLVEMFLSWLLKNACQVVSASQCYCHLIVFFH